MISHFPQHHEVWSSNCHEDLLTGCAKLTEIAIQNENLEVANIAFEYQLSNTRIEMKYRIITMRSLPYPKFDTLCSPLKLHCETKNPSNIFFSTNVNIILKRKQNNEKQATFYGNLRRCWLNSLEFQNWSWKKKQWVRNLQWYI